jgi:hypothetical protein
LHCGRIKQLIMHEADEQVFHVGTSPTSEKRPISLSSIDMNKTAENTKTAINKVGANPRQMKGVMSAVKAVIGEEPDTFDGVDEHPGGLDLPTPKTQNHKVACRLRAPAERIGRAV